MHSYGSIAIVSILWIIIGYSLSFAPGGNAWIGGFDWVGLKGVSFKPNPDYSGTIPHNLFMMFQLMFAVLTPAIMSGALAERMRFFQLLFCSHHYGQLSYMLLLLIGYGE
ncbi:hypothetical protein GCM10020331_007340 [Ectobacillus funiculus]